MLGYSSSSRLVEAFLSETDYKIEKLIVDGGVARLDWKRKKS